MLNVKSPIAIVKFGWAVTVYLVLSFILFLTTSFTMMGWIIYLFLLLPIYSIILLGLCFFVWRNRSKSIQVKCWIWQIVLVLQLATIIVSPGNCYGFTQGDRCYSHLQILAGGAPNQGFSATPIPHWKIVEDSFLGVTVAYGVALTIGIFSSSLVENEEF